MIWVGSLSCQSFGFQPFHIFAQRDLLLLVFGQRAVRWTERVIGVIFSFTHDVTFPSGRRRTLPIIPPSGAEVKRLQLASTEGDQDIRYRGNTGKTRRSGVPFARSLQVVG